LIVKGFVLKAEAELSAFLAHLWAKTNAKTLSSNLFNKLLSV